jgi:sec-independent protein translocase protein TatA
MGSIGPGELAVLALVLLLVFGAGRIADIGKGLGQAIRQFKHGVRDDARPEDAKGELRS